MTATATQLTEPTKLVGLSTSKRIQNTSKRKVWSDVEVAIIRNDYPTLGIKKTLKLLPGRTHSSLVQKAEKLGIKVAGNHRRRWTADEIQTLESEWEFTRPSVIARMLNRKLLGVINKAEVLGLRRGPPEGCDYVSVVAIRMGYDPATFYGILKHFNVPITRLDSAPYGKKKRRKTKTNRRFKAKHRYVDVMEAEDAVKKWVTETETIPKAAERHNITHQRLSELLVLAGLKVICKDKKFTFRVNTKTIDKLVADWRKAVEQKEREDSRFETLLEAAARHGLWYETLQRWLKKAGFSWNPVTRQWRLDPADVDRVVQESLAKSVLAKINGVRVNGSKTEYRKFVALLRWKVREAKAAQRSFLSLLKLRAQQQQVVERDARRLEKEERAAERNLKQQKKQERATQLTLLALLKRRLRALKNELKAQGEEAKVKAKQSRTKSQRKSKVR